MKVYRIWPDVGQNPHTEDSIEATVESIRTWLEEGAKGTVIMVRILEMSEEEFGNLPEYMGP